MRNLKQNVDQEYLNWDYFESIYLDSNSTIPKGLTSICSPMGSGKTKILANIAKTAKKQRFNILALSSRISLASKLASDLELNSYLDDKQCEFNAQLNNYSVCINSLVSKLNNYGKSICDFSEYIIIIDEAVQLIHNLCSSTVDNYKTITAVEYIIKTAHAVVLTDAHLNQDIIDIFETMRYTDYDRIRPNYKQQLSPLDFLGIDLIKSIKQHYSENLDDSNFHIKNITKAHNKQFIEMGYVDIIHSLYNDISNGLKLYIASDSKMEAETIRGFIYAYFDHNFTPSAALMTKPKVLLITADNSKSKEIQNLLQEPSKLTEYDIVICSPAISTGISIDGNEHISTIYDDILDETVITKFTTFDKIYGIFKGNSIHYTDMMQMLFRVRETRTVTYAFIQSNSSNIEQYYTQYEIENKFNPAFNFNTNIRVANILLNKIQLKPSIGTKRSYIAIDNKVSTNEYTKIYQKMKIENNFDIINQHIPKSLSVFLVQLYHAQEMRKSYTAPNFHFRKLVIDEDHPYSIQYQSVPLPELSDMKTMYWQNYILSKSKQTNIHNINSPISKIDPAEFELHIQAWNTAYSQIFEIGPILNASQPLTYDTNVDLAEPDHRAYYKRSLVELLSPNNQNNEATDIIRMIEDKECLEHILVHLYYLIDANVTLTLNNTQLKKNSIIIAKCKLHHSLMEILDTSGVSNQQNPSVISNRITHWDDNILSQNNDISNFIINNMDLIHAAFPDNNTATKIKTISVIHQISKFGVFKHKRTSIRINGDIVSHHKLVINTNELYIKLLTIMANWSCNHQQLAFTNLLDHYDNIHTTNSNLLTNSN